VDCNKVAESCFQNVDCRKVADSCFEIWIVARLQRVMPEYVAIHYNELFFNIDCSKVAERNVSKCGLQQLL
jgi:hypothetical protein